MKCFDKTHTGTMEQSCFCRKRNEEKLMIFALSTQCILQLVTNGSKDLDACKLLVVACHNSPWTIVAGNNKKFARIQILRSICHQLEDALGGQGENH